MIVRNEAAIIERALASVATQLSYWVVCDTGSTDGTQDIVQRFFRERGIPGELHEFPFENFSSARNRALDAARRSAGRFDYLLLMDADMELRVVEDAFRAGLGQHAYQVRQKAGISYYNTRLVRRDVPATYKGVTHEYLELPSPAARLDAIWFADGANGSNRVGKFDRDAALLTDALKSEPDNARYVFYLAQSYRDAGRLDLALETYRRRQLMAGWDEERWYAVLQEARCLRLLGRDDAFIARAMQAYNERPGRAEPLYDLALHYRLKGQYEAAMLFALSAFRLPRPLGDSLFVEDHIYDYGIRQEISIAGYYCASLEDRQAGHAACASLAANTALPAEVRALAETNLRYYRENGAAGHRRGVS
ncbi:MAG: glycosyltransferase [Hyphomicrobiales bacterium]|nr:MAG: glycosyltransferase [Hyphomicrobiales bacterium]